MREQHLSDEAIAAFADDVLSGHARERARRHTARCTECNYAVAVQREAVWALRAAPAPSLPAGLLERLREVPDVTPVRRVPSHVDEHGTAMLSTVAGAAALVASPRQLDLRTAGRRGRNVAMTALSVLALSAFTGSAVAADSAPPEHPADARPTAAPPTAAPPTAAQHARPGPAPTAARHRGADPGRGAAPAPADQGR